MHDSEFPEKPWLLHYPWQVAPSCRYPAGNAAALLLEWAERSPGAKPGGCLGPAWNCARLARASRKFANALAGLGIGRGERVALLLHECPQAVIAFYGTLLAGAAVVLLEAQAGAEAAAAARSRLIETGAAVIVVSDSHLPAIASSREGTSLRAIIATSRADASPSAPARLPAPRFPGDGLFARRRNSGVERWSHLLRRFPDTPVCAEVDADRHLAMIRYTRGALGVPKAAALTHANLIAGAVQTAAWRYAEDQAQLRYLAALPAGRRYDRGEGGAGYLLAEAAAPPLAQPANRLGRSGTLGLPLPDTEARIVGENGLEPLAPGQIGELAVRGPQISAAYWNAGVGEAVPSHPDGWLRTGDLAVMDEDGFFAIVDRKEEAIPRGGLTVYPRRVEQELAKHPAVASAAVIGVRSLQGVTSIRAFVTLKGGSRASAMQLRRWGLERLAPHETPDEFEVCERLPSKRSLRESLGDLP